MEQYRYVTQQVSYMNTDVKTDKVVRGIIAILRHKYNPRTIRIDVLQISEKLPYREYLRDSWNDKRGEKVDDSSKFDSTHQGI